MENYTIEKIAKFEEQSKKCDQLIKKGAEQLEKLGVTFRKLVELQHKLKIPTEREKEMNKINDEKFPMINKRIESIERKREELSRKQNYDKNDFDKRLKPIKNEISEVNKILDSKKTILENQLVTINELSLKINKSKNEYFTE